MADVNLTLTQALTLTEEVMTSPINLHLSDSMKFKDEIKRDPLKSSPSTPSRPDIPSVHKGGKRT